MRNIDVIASGSIDVNRLKARGSPSFVTTGTHVAILDSKFKASTEFSNGTVDVEAGPGSTCDLSGSQFEGIDVITSCANVIGP